MMRAEFAIAVDPIFELALRSIADIDGGLSVEPTTLRDQFLQLFDRADALQGSGTQWRLAKYALAAWIDEMCLTSDWAGSQWWRDHILEMEYFQSRECSVRFFELAEQASAQRERDALEVFVNCVQLGFRGALTTTEAWLQRMTARIPTVDLAPGAATGYPDSLVAQYPQRNMEGAPPSQARYWLVWWSLAAVVLVFVNGWVYRAVLLGD